MPAPRCLLAAATTTVVATTAFVLVAPPTAQAAPEPQSTTVTATAPYGEPATFDTYGANDCDPTTLCEVSGSSDAGTGRSRITAAYQRNQPVSGAGGVSGWAGQGLSYAVPRSATTVTAELTYRVDAASAVAAPTAGSVHAAAGMFAAISGDCTGATCRTTSATRTVVRTYGPHGLPGPPQRVTEPRTETLTLTATGALPPVLLLQATTFAAAHGYGEYGPVCLNWDGCSDPAVPAHAGRADADIDATLVPVRFTSS